MSWRAVWCLMAATVGGSGRTSAQEVDSMAAAAGVYRPASPSDTMSPPGLAGDTLLADTLSWRPVADSLADTTRGDTAATDSLARADTSAADTSQKQNALQPVEEPEPDTSLTARMDARRGGGIRREDFPDLLSTATMTGGYRTFLGLVNRSKLRRVLTGADPVTVLAPTDSAFAKLDAADLNRLRDNSAARDAWLGTLILGGDLKSGNLVRAGEVRSRAGSVVHFSMSDSVVRAGTARLVQPDLIARNGVLHGVDRVVLPNSTSASP